MTPMQHEESRKQGPQISQMRLVGTLGVAGALAGLLLVFVHQWTAPAILAHNARLLELAVAEVLHEPARTETLYVIDGKLRAKLPSGIGETDVERVFAGYDEDGKLRGYAVSAAEAGFQDTVRLIFGYDPSTGKLLGMKVLESKETPGLGDKIERDSVFIDQFDGVSVPVVGVKSGKTRAEEVDMITGATISSRAVIRIIDGALERLQVELDAHAKAEPQ